MKPVYRVMLAVNYLDGRQRELFYSENKERAELKFEKACKTIDRIARDNALKIHDIKHSDVWHTYVAADSNNVYARAEILVRNETPDNFLDFYNEPTF